VTDDQELVAIARTIVDTNDYMTLGTADADGHPWVSPVWYAPEAYRELFWLSSPDARHSRNLAARPELSIVIFDSQVRMGAGQAVYMSAVAAEPEGADRERGLEIFSRRSLAHGGRAFTIGDLEPTGLLRLYRAAVSEHWVLDPDLRPDQRRALDLEQEPRATKEGAR
jgi:hypothetical protein